MKESTEERRKSRGRRVLKTAKLLTAAEQLYLDVVIRDSSDTGLKIQLLKEVALPNAFEIIFVAEQTRQNCRLVWQNGMLAGVELLGEKSPIKLRRLG